MMTLKIKVFDIRVGVGDWPEALRLIQNAIDAAIQETYDAIAFSELSLCSIDANGYLKHLDNQRITLYLRVIAHNTHKKAPNFSIFIGHPWRANHKKFYNAYSHLARGDIVAMFLKQHLDTYASRLEERDYLPAASLGMFSLTIPETHAFPSEGNMIVHPEKTIPAGKIHFHLTHTTPNEIIPTIGDAEIDKPDFLKKLSKAIILNPTSTPPGSHIPDLHQQREKQMQDASVHTYLRIGEDILCYERGQILQQDYLDGIDYQIRWLFDYVIYSGLPKIHFVMEISDDISSIYHACLIEAMIKKYSLSLGLDELILKLGHQEHRDEICGSNNPTQSLLNQILTCVYFRDGHHNLNTENTIKSFIQDIGARCLVRDTQTVITGIAKTLHKKNNLHDEDYLQELAKTSLCLTISNSISGISLTHLPIDRLIIHPHFGGKLHQGQLNPSGCFFITELAEMLEKIDKKNPRPFIKNLLDTYRHSEHFTQDKQFHLIASQALYATHQGSRKKHHPIDVFKFCQQSALFENVDTSLLYKKIVGFYHAWASAQYAIHASPITCHYNQRAVEHNKGLRIPVINGYYFSELKKFEEWWQGVSVVDSPRPVAFEEIRSTLSPHGIKIAQASLNQTAGDWDRNLNNIFSAIDLAAADQSDILLLPELSLTGYDCGDLFQHIDNTRIQTLLQKILYYLEQKQANLLVSIGHPWQLSEFNKPFNVQSLLGEDENGRRRILMMKYKSELYDDGRGFERRYFSDELIDEPSIITIPAYLDTPAYHIPIGKYLVARIGNPTQGYIDFFQSICEEYWTHANDETQYAEKNIIGHIKKQGYEIDVYATAHASPPAPKKLKQHEYLTTLASRYIAQDGIVLHTDSLGTSGGSYVNAGTRYAAQHGKIIVDGAGVYSFQDVVYTSRQYSLTRRQTKPNEPTIWCSHNFFSSLTEKEQNTHPDPWRELPPNTVEIELSIRNQVLALYDIMRKSKVRCFTQALSGGADSAWNITKIRLMIELGVRELGIRAFLTDLHYSEKTIQTVLAHDSMEDKIRSIMRRFTVCYYLATPNNSIATQKAAESFADRIGSTFIVLDIQPLLNHLSLTLFGLPMLPNDQTSMDGLIENLNTCLFLNPSPEGEQHYQQILRTLHQQHPDADGVILSPCQSSLSVTVENAQARSRQMLISFLTYTLNKHPEYLTEFIPAEMREDWEAGCCFGLANPNENEACRAYTTFAGDLHSGEINPNGHLPKDEQLKQMHYVNKRGLHTLTPITALDDILHQIPSAELQPKVSGKVIQFDENAFGMTFAEATIINHARAQYTDPWKVFKSCQNDPVFSRHDIATLHDKIFLAYRSSMIALNKLVAAPLIQTYGEWTVDSKSSLQMPIISTHEEIELVIFTLRCLEKLSPHAGKTFKELTGYDLKIIHYCTMVEKNFAKKIICKMYTENPSNRLPYQLKKLIE